MRSSARRHAAGLVTGVTLAWVSLALAQPASPVTAQLTAIRREAIPGAIRVTIELDRETAFREDRLDGPPRVFLDFPNTNAAATLKDRSMSFDGDAVRHVRVGRPTPGVTRVVLDLHGAARYSVYALYGPFRLVIDVERASAAMPRPASAPQARRPSASPVAPLVSPGIAAAPAPLLSRPAAPARELTSGAAEPRPTPGASWLPDVLPARTIAVAIASATRSTGPETALATAAARSARGAERPVVSPAVPSMNTAGGYSLSRQLGLGISRVVIDPGHGGHDPGAKVQGLNEADIVLDISQRLETILKRQPGVEVVLTRRSNVYVPLEERTAIANREGADLFLSVHANASENPKARGLETYYLNFAQNPEAERIAARENAGAARTMHALPDIVKAIALNNKIDESRDFAAIVQTSLVERLRRSNRNTRDLGVKQAPFMVLIGATMPSILAEVSFITNDDESRLLKTAAYRQQIADALFQGIQRYQRGLKANVRLAAQ